MRIFRYLALLMPVAALAQIPAPQISLTGNIGCQGFPCLNNGTLNLTSDADYTMTARDTSAMYIKVTSSVPLTTIRTLRYPAGNFPVGVENATTGGQAISVCPTSGLCVQVPNSTSYFTQIWYDGTNFVQIASSGGGGIGGGTVTGFSAGSLSPLFTASVANASTTPALTFSLNSVANSTFLGNFSGGPAGPSFYTLSAGANVTLTPSGSTLTISSSGTGSGCAPSGSANDILTNNGSGGCAGSSGAFSYNPSTQVFTHNFYSSVPGFNLGGTSGSTGIWQETSDYPTNYSQANFVFDRINNARCNGNGDCNILDMYWHYNGNGNDANGEGGVGIRNYPFIGDPTYVGVLSGSALGGTQLTFSSNNGTQNFGNGRYAIVQESATSVTITATATHTTGAGAYLEATTSSTFTPSGGGTLATGFVITPASTNPIVSESFTLNSVTTGCAVNDIATWIPNGPPGQVDTGKITAAGSVSGGSQAITMDVRYSEVAGSILYCHGPQEFLDYPSQDLNGNKLIYQVAGASSSTNLIVVGQGSGGPAAPTIPAGSATLYTGAMLIDSRDQASLSTQPDGNGFNALTENNTTWTTGNHVEVANGVYQHFGFNKIQAISNNPYAGGYYNYVFCTANDAACGDYQSGVNGVIGNAWINMNSSGLYNCLGCGGNWNMAPLNFIQGPWGPLAYYLTVHNAPIVELSTTTGTATNFLQIDDHTAYWQWNGSSDGWYLAGDNITFGANNGAVSNTNFNIRIPSGTIATCAGFATSSIQLIQGSCPGGGGGMVYPGAGIANSTGTAWGTSYSAQGTDTKLLTSGTVSGTGVTLCTDANGGATTTGCPSGSSGISGLTTGYIPVAGSATTINGNSHIDDGVTTAATLTATEPLVIAGATQGFGVGAGTMHAGAAGQVWYGSDATTGYAEVNENNTGYAHVCTATNGVCGGGVADTTVTIGTTAVAASGCSSAATVTMTGLTTSMTAQFTPTSDVSAVTGWGPVTPGLYIQPWPSAANTLSYKVCNSSGSSITPGASVTFNISAR